MNDETTIQLLRDAMAAETTGHHLDPGAAATALADSDPTPSRGRRRDRWAVAAVLAGAAAVAGVYAASSAREGTGRPATSASCGPVQHGSLPVWARTGFTPPDHAIDHVLSAGGQITAILFLDLRAHQPAGTNNKILWAARDGGGTGPLVIRATLPGRAAVTRTVGNGPGPSIIDLPVPGCWQLDLRWGNHHDTMSLLYAP